MQCVYFAVGWLSLRGIFYRDIDGTKGEHSRQQPDQTIAAENVSPYSGYQEYPNTKKDRAMKYSFDPVLSSNITIHILFSPLDAI
jgi:hypothetical protein